jgi:ATP-dependent Clp protease adapter protein ClpS
MSKSQIVDYSLHPIQKLPHVDDPRDARPRVKMYNDRFNKRAKMQEILENVAKLNSTAANHAMMEAHETGKGVVKQFFGEDSEAKKLCDALRKEDLLVELETVVKETDG